MRGASSPKHCLPEVRAANGACARSSEVNGPLVWPNAKEIHLEPPKKTAPGTSCWNSLIDAEQRLLEREYEVRMTSTSSDPSDRHVDPPRPPDFLIDRVVSGFENDDAERHRTLFDQTGKQSLRDITMALAGIGRTFPEFPRILDFGCGCARVTRWLQYETGDSELFGCDIDAEAIAWNQINIHWSPVCP